MKTTLILNVYVAIPCRINITKNDWQDPAIAKKLWPEWPAFIQKEIIKRGIIK